MEAALASASRILPLITTAHHPSAANNRYWPEIYTNMPIVTLESLASAGVSVVDAAGSELADPEETRPQPYADTTRPRRFGTVTALDPATALLVAGAIVFAGVRILDRSSRVLVDEALPEEELAAIRVAIEGHEAQELAGFHKLRARRAGSRRYIDLHVQFRPGTSLERAHAVSHELQGEIAGRMRGADVLIHLEPAEPGPPS
jgi:hypothetical protein